MDSKLAKANEVTKNYQKHNEEIQELMKEHARECFKLEKY